jgi:hypothetical protein
MANRKISDLTALTAPASGDLLPIVDISEAAAADKNKKITIGELFASIPLGTAAAPSIAFEGDINTGIYSPGADQLAISTNGTSRIVFDASGRILVDVAANANGGILQLSSGITFPATAVAASDANTLDDYEEGTWTGTDGSGAGLSIVFVGGRYTKIGRLVYVSAETITYPVTASTASATLGGLPFTNGGQNTGVAALITANVNANRALVVANTTTAFFYATSTLANSTNAQLSAAIIYAFTAVYQV